MNIQKILPACAVAMGVALVMATSAFTKAPTNKSGDPSYYFQYQSGDASNPANWQFTSSGSGCSGAGESCKILLPEEYVNTSTSPVSIDASTLPGNILPTVAGSGSNKVPDPSATGIYLHISNKNP